MKHSDTELLDCGHKPDKGMPASVRQSDKTIKTVQGWTSVLLEDGRKVCHNCAAEQILDCGHKLGLHEGMSAGYGRDSEEKRICYECCAVRDKEQMERDGKAVLYLTHADSTTIGIHGARQKNFGSYIDGKVTNWPGTLSFKARVRIGRHNIAGSRYDCWFKDEKGNKWHGVQYGEWTQIVHCRRLKAQNKAA